MRIKETGQPFTIFEYYGQYTYDYESTEPILDKVDTDDESVTTRSDITDD